MVGIWELWVKISQDKVQTELITADVIDKKQEVQKPVIEVTEDQVQTELIADDVVEKKEELMSPQIEVEEIETQTDLMASDVQQKGRAFEVKENETQICWQLMWEKSKKTRRNQTYKTKEKIMAI